MSKETVVQYIVAEGPSVVELEQSVSRYLKQGFIPQAGICHNPFPDIRTGSRFLQAMIKTE